MFGWARFDAPDAFGEAAACDVPHLRRRRDPRLDLWIA